MVEMKELKPNLFTRLKGFFLLHPVAVAIIAVIFAIMLFGGCEKARAEGLDQYYLDTLRPMFPDFTDAQWDIVESCAKSCPYFIKLDSSNSSYRILIMYPYSSQYVYDHSSGVGNSDPCYCVGGSSSNIGVGGFSLSPYSLGNISGNSSYAHYAFIDYLTAHEVHGMKYSPSSQYYDSSSSWNMRWFSCSTTAIVGSSVSASFAYSRDSYLTNDYCVFETNYTSFTKFEKNIEKPTYVDDNRLKFTKINSSYDGEILMTDISQFLTDFPIHDTSHSSVYLDPESITLKYTVNGSEKSITLDSSNSTIRSKYIFETPIYMFDFDDDNSSVIITNADFTIYGTSQSSPYEASETYRISCEYYIVSPVQPIQPTVIPTPIYNDPNVKSQQDITRIVYYLNNWSTSYSRGEFLLMYDAPDLPSWADRYTDTLYRFTNDSSPSVAGEFTTMPTYSSLSGWQYDIINVYDYIADIIDVYDNVYDVFIFPVDYWFVTDTVINPDYTDRGIQGYIVFLSERYYTRQIGFNSIDILDILQISSNNDILFFEDLRAKIDDFESESLEYFNAKLAIDEDILSWLRTIDYSINGINIPEPDYSDITSRLNYIMDKLSIIANQSSQPSEDDTVSEAIAYFKLHSLNGFPIQSVFDENKLSIWMAGKVHSWLQGTDSQTTKTSLLNDAFDTLTSIYDALTNESDFFGNMEKYLGSLRGSFIQDLDGLYFSRFFQNSFDPDSYDGGSL